MSESRYFFKFSYLTLKEDILCQKEDGRTWPKKENMSSQKRTYGNPRSELYFLGSNYFFFMILRDPSQFLGKILTGQNIGKNSLYDTDVSSLWKNVEKKGV